MTRTVAARKLAIYVTDGCFGCDVARDMAERINNLHVPGLNVMVVDLNQPGINQPSQVFAVPTYLLDDTVISLGNPEEQWLLAELTKLTAIPDERKTDLHSR